jgi:hypothetical protein
MNLENVKKWTDALRSGKYDQGQKMLRSADDEFCCLGVGCDVLGVDYVGAGGYPPEGFWETLGIEVGNGTEEFQEELVRLNDSDKASFPAIADYIEKRIGSLDEQA